MVRNVNLPLRNQSESTSSAITSNGGAGAVEQKTIEIFDPELRDGKSVTMAASDLSRMTNRTGVIVVVTHISGVSDDFHRGQARPFSRGKLKVISRPAQPGKIIGID
jgi:hypothetical protein